MMQSVALNGPEQDDHTTGMSGGGGGALSVEAFRMP